MMDTAPTLAGYTLLETLGAGSFGCVRKALCDATGQLVAVKTMAKEYATWKEAVELREIQCLMRLSHPNIVALLQVVRDANCQLHLVFEYVEGSIYRRLKQSDSDGMRPLSAPQVTNVAYQLLQGLAHMHGAGIMHRDLKPENLLLNSNLTLKICDLGLARATTDEPPFTSYHATRWYRAPELLLEFDHYTAAVDMWAVGCLIPELYSGKPLFPGTTELNQLNTICKVKGTFTDESWAAGMAVLRKRGVNLPQHESQLWSAVAPGASAEAIQLMDACLRWDPACRATARDCMSYPLFDVAMLLE